MTRNKIILIAGIAATIVLLMAGAYFGTGGLKRPLLLSISFEAAPTGAANAMATTPTPAAPPSGLMIDLGSKVVNLADPGGYRYLRAQIVLELDPNARNYSLLTGDEKTEAEEALRDEIARHRPAIDDVIVGVLSNKSFGDVFSLSGKEALKSELCDAINDQLTGLKVVRIYFTDFVIQ